MIDNQIRELSAPNLPRYLLGVGADWAIIVLALAAARSVNHPIGYLLALLVVGNRQHALELIGHDAAHGLASRTRWLNDLAGAVLSFWPIWSGLGTYRKFHFAHHSHLGSATDPEQVYKAWSPAHWNPPTSRGHILTLFFLDLFGINFWELLRLFGSTPPPQTRDWLGPLAWHAVFIGVCLWTGQWWILPIWYIAPVTSFWAMFRLRMWTEHVGTRETYRISVSWWQRLLFLPHNTWYHYEHHRWPSIPYWNLPQARKLDSTELVVPLNALIASYGATS